MSGRVGMLVVMGFLLLMIGLLIFSAPESDRYRTYLGGLVTCAIGLLFVLAPLRWRWWRLAGELRDRGNSLEGRYLGSNRSYLDVVLGAAVLTLSVLFVHDPSTLRTAGFRAVLISAAGILAFLVVRLVARISRSLARRR